MIRPMKRLKEMMVNGSSLDTPNIFRFTKAALRQTFAEQAAASNQKSEEMLINEPPNRINEVTNESEVNLAPLPHQLATERSKDNNGKPDTQ